MNKRIAIVLISIFVLFLGNTFLIAEEPLAFYGIKFGSTTQEVKKIMESKNWTVDKEETDDTKKTQYLVFKKDNGEFAGRTVEYMEFNFGENSLYQTTAFFGFSPKGTPISQIAKAYSEKYGFTPDPNTPSGDKYIDAKGNTFLIFNFLFRVLSVEVFNKISGWDKKLENDI